MNNKILTLVLAVSIAAIPAALMAQTASPSPDPSSDAVSSTAAPSADLTTSSASPSPTPTTPSPSSGITSSTAAPSSGDTTSTAAPSSGGTTSTAAPSSGDASSSAGPSSTPTPTPTPPSGGGGGSTSSSGSFYGGGSSGGSFVGTALPVVLSAATTSCPLLTSYLQFGANNDGAQVTKLQIFLKDSQGLDVDINGVFDQKTESAVNAFQVKYLSDIMGPWGATQGSGFVYITTEKKINELACNSPLTLSPAEIAIIDAYKNAEANGQNNNGIGSTAGGNLNASSTILGPVGVNGNGSANTASVINASIFQRVWDFIKSLF